MPTKRSRPGSPATPATTYSEWRAHAAALLERRGILSGVMRERRWRQLLITGVTPEQAVEQAQVHYNNTRPPFERLRKRWGRERSNGTDKVLARAVNMLIARGAYWSTSRMYPEDWWAAPDGWLRRANEGQEKGRSRWIGQGRGYCNR
jgi:hypothetical protein